MHWEADESKYQTKRELSTIYLDDGERVADWLKSDKCIGILYGEFLYAAGEIIYDTHDKSPVANVKSIEYRELLGYEVGLSLSTQIILTNRNLMDHLDRLMNYALKHEYYLDCAKIRDMIADYESGKVHDSGSL